MADYASLSSAPSAYPHVSYSSYLHIKDVNNSTDARFSADDHSLSGDGIPSSKARITDLVTDVKDIKTDIKDIKTEVKKLEYAFQTIQQEKALQTSQKEQLIDFFSEVAVGIFVASILVLGVLLILVYFTT
jgi:hypothetical protein